jgi:hypothetical protein
VSSSAAKRRVLFLYNVPDWAIHNVGRDWGELLAATHEFTLARYGEHEALDPAAFDHVVWGYSTLRYSGRMLMASLARRPLGLWRWQRARGPGLCAVVQDPSELFPEVADWRAQAPRLEHLRRFARIAVTSNEMLAVLAEHGVAASKVNTRSRLPLRAGAEVAEEPLRVFTRAQRYPRKNLPLFESLARRFAGTLERCDAILGGAVLPEANYIRQIDGYNCYVCTSWQEGGPLPLMDALRRGCVVLTTPVGQTDELVSDGVNGYFCRDEAEFASRLQELHDSPRRLADMRRAALARAADSREALVCAQLKELLP